MYISDSVAGRPLLVLSTSCDIKHWLCRNPELSLIPVLVEEGLMWTTSGSGLTGTLSIFHQLVAILASLWSARFLQVKVFSPKALSMNQPTCLQFKMAPEKRTYLM